MKTLLAFITAILIAGCSKHEQTVPDNGGKDVKAPLQPASSTARDAIEGMTGKTAVDQGRKTQDKIRAISAEQNKKLNEVMDDQ